MSDLVAVLVLIGGGVAALALTLLRARRRGAAEATAKLRDEEVRHAHEIAETVANARAERKAQDTRRSDGAGTGPDRMRKDPYRDRGWRD